MLLDLSFLFSIRRSFIILIETLLKLLFRREKNNWNKICVQKRRKREREREKKVERFIEFRSKLSLERRNRRWIAVKQQKNRVEQYTSISSNTVTSTTVIHRGSHNGYHWKRFVRDKNASPLPAIPFVLRLFRSAVNRSRIIA